MRAAAARVLLHGQTGGDDVVGAPPILQDLLGVEGAGAVEHLQEALLVLERRRVGGEALARQHRRKEAAPRRVADMQGLGHRAEMALMPAASEAAIASACAVFG